MTIDEVRKLRIKAQDSIEKIIDDFFNDTGVSISNIYYSRIQGLTKTRIINIELEVKI